MNASDYVTSIIRTGAPVLAGILVTWLLHFGIHVSQASEAQLVTLSVFGFSMGYYALARWLEAKWPNLGWLLGSPKKPVYGKQP